MRRRESPPLTVERQLTAVGKRPQDLLDEQRIPTRLREERIAELERDPYVSVQGDSCEIPGVGRVERRELDLEEPIARKLIDRVPHGETLRRPVAQRRKQQSRTGEPPRQVRE